MRHGLTSRERAGVSGAGKRGSERECSARPKGDGGTRIFTLKSSSFGQSSPLRPQISDLKSEFAFARPRNSCGDSAENQTGLAYRCIALKSTFCAVEPSMKGSVEGVNMNSKARDDRALEFEDRRLFGGDDGHGTLLASRLGSLERIVSQGELNERA